MNLDQFPGVNAGYVLELYDRYRQDPESVDPATRKIFEAWTPGETGASAATPAATPQTLQAAVGAANLAESIRRYGHLAARVDPLGSTPIGDPSLSPRGARHHRRRPQAAARVARRRPGRRGVGQRLRGDREAAARSTARRPASTSRTCSCPEEREWLRHAAESGRFLPPLDATNAEALLDRLTQVEVFERFLHRTFPGKTRFSVEGLDMLVPGARRDHLRRRRPGHPPHAARHGAPRPPQRARARARQAVLADPRRVQGPGADADAGASTSAGWAT